jgi:multiple sugar transport system permease protein
LHLVDSLLGLGIVYVGASMSVAIWMMAAYMDSIPMSLEQAAWIDGASVFGGFLRIVLRNSLPGILSTAIFTYLVSWNDYLVALVFIRTTTKYTLPLGVESLNGDWGSVMALSLVIMTPPLIVFGCLNRFFSVGGIGGALAG